MSSKSNDTSRPPSPNIAIHQSEDHGLSHQESDDHGTSRKPVERASTGDVAESSEAHISESQDVTATGQNEDAEAPARPSLLQPVTVQAVPTVIVCPKERTPRAQPRPSSLAREPAPLEGSSSHVRPRKSVVILDYQQQPYHQQYYVPPGQPMMVQGQPMMMQQPMMVQQPMMMQQPVMMQPVQQQPPPQQEQQSSGGCCASCCRLCCSLCIGMACLAYLSPCLVDQAGEGMAAAGEHAGGCLEHAGDLCSCFGGGGD